MPPAAAPAALPLPAPVAPPPPRSTRAPLPPRQPRIALILAVAILADADARHDDGCMCPE